VASKYVASDAAVYDRMIGRWSRRLAKLFIEFAAIDKAEKLLDVGCGTGSLTFALADLYPRASITGIDLGQAYVDHARSLVANRKLTFEQGDATALPYAEHSFDAALSLLMLNFIPDAGRAAAELVRVAKPGGVVSAAVWDFRGGAVFLRVLADTAAALDPSGEAFRANVFSGAFTSPGEFAAA
jgi:ubiquinone/menaquinone biosynthesis C-methylase UbiE